MNLFSGYSDPLFQDSESYLRTVIVFVEDDIPLVLKRSGFIRYEWSPSFYTFKDLSEVLAGNFQPYFEIRYYPNHSITIEYSHIAMKSKQNVRIGIIAMPFDEKSFFSTILAFTLHCDCKHYIEYSSQKTISDRFVILDKIHLEWVCIDGFVVNGVWEPSFSSFDLIKRPGYQLSFFVDLGQNFIKK